MEAIEASATLRFHRISPQRTRLVADMIRGRKVEEAMRILRFTNRRSADVLVKLLKSAVANAEGKNVEEPELLRVEKVWVCQGPVYRRQMPRARGRANIIRRPTSHITILVKEDIKEKEAAAAERAAREAKRAKKRAARKKGGEKAAKEKKASPKAKAGDAGKDKAAKKSSGGGAEKKKEK